MKESIVLACALAIAGCRADPPPSPPAPPPSAGASAASHADACAPPTVIVVPAREPPADATLVMLHGYGANAADIEPVARALAAASPKLALFIPDGCDPAGTSPSGREWLPRGVPRNERSHRIAQSGDRVRRFVAAELARRGLPTDRVVWAGFSQGAMLSQWMAIHGSPRPLAVVSFSGLFGDDQEPGAPVDTPVLLIHGERDAMIPFSEAERAERELAARGAKVERLDRPMMPHSIDDESRAAAVEFVRKALTAR